MEEIKMRKKPPHPRRGQGIGSTEMPLAEFLVPYKPLSLPSPFFISSSPMKGACGAGIVLE
jgi:hypothetical protein